MKSLILILGMALIAGTVHADETISFTTTAGKGFNKVTIADESKAGLTVVDASGTKTFIRIEDLPKNLKDECMHHAHHSMDSIGGM